MAVKQYFFSTDPLHGMRTKELILGVGGAGARGSVIVWALEPHVHLFGKSELPSSNNLV